MKKVSASGERRKQDLFKTKDDNTIPNGSHALAEGQAVGRSLLITVLLAPTWPNQVVVDWLARNNAHSRLHDDKADCVDQRQLLGCIDDHDVPNTWDENGVASELIFPLKFITKKKRVVGERGGMN